MSIHFFDCRPWKLNNESSYRSLDIQNKQEKYLTIFERDLIDYIKLHNGE